MESLQTEVLTTGDACHCSLMGADDRNVQVQAIWEQFSVRLCAFICRRIADEQTAEDILQEVFIRIHARLHTVRDTTRLESWLYQIARNAIIDDYRGRRPVTALPEWLADESDAEETAETRLLPDIRELVMTLPEPYREALLLTEYEGLSQKELAAHQGISLSGAKSRVQRARQKIRDQLLTCCHFEFDRRGAVLDYYEHCCCCAGTSSANRA